ncbi:transglutaminase superfamily protein [Flavobacterium sp. 1]|uniref:transglutaminase domain-containing protein n=1 Tax=Flavobacterium sp. 1 TaxID=2035200 RepID=UPI000C24E2AD|nr:transglutaminase domain-containing protein [Flavobacterium sp. 1]PJJ09627.1 transglutaminase superfamily protein [Flavobacterium sp. 1]
MKSVFVFLMFTVFSFGQVKNPYALTDAKIDKIPADLSTSTDGIAKYINENLKLEKDKIRAVFYWTASNISYDIENIASIDFKEVSPDKIKNTVLSKKGVCIHYAEVFNDIAKKVNIKAYIIYGYTKQNGKVDVLSHAWCAARIDNTWWLFDPTWGSGYVDKNKFFKKLNNLNYKVLPNQFIATHMPFDYLWQFLNYTVANQEFIDGKSQINKTKPKFDFVREIEEYDQMSDLDKARTALIRIQNNGIKNSLIQEMAQFKKSEVDALQNNEAMSKMQGISDDYNQAIAQFNDFIMYRNNKFKPLLPDEAIKEMIVAPKQKILDCQNRIYKIGKFNDNNFENVKSLKKSIIDVLKQIEDQEKFVNEYLSKSKSARKGMFTKVTWFGVPLN